MTCLGFHKVKTLFFISSRSILSITVELLRMLLFLILQNKKKVYFFISWKTKTLSGSTVLNALRDFNRFSKRGIRKNYVRSKLVQLYDVKILWHLLLAALCYVYADWFVFEKRLEI